MVLASLEQSALERLPIAHNGLGPAVFAAKVSDHNPHQHTATV